MRGLWAMAALWALAGCSSAGTSSEDPCVTGKNRCSSGTFFFCDDGGARSFTCKGTCTTTCDTSMHSLGDGCTSNGKFRCDPLNTARALVCASGVYELYQGCSGPRGCFIDSNRLRCEASVGDLCPPPLEGSYACDSLDTNQVVKCVDAGIIATQRCPGTTTCIYVDGGLACQ